ncbi:MAG TPA: hypothetical protein DHN29_18380 [Cytophagales bacterium]|nr:hypothetical protein [Cytophagales bacterium]
MRVIKIVVLIVFLLVLAVLSLIYFLPDKAHMEREIVIDAPASKVYQDLIFFRNFNKWSPWAAKDPNAQYTYTGADFGPGAVIAWTSEHPDLGDGSLEILLTEKSKRVIWEMKFDGYESTPTSSFLLNPVEESKTKVVWTYDEEGIKGFSKIFMLGIDGFLGGDWESGLAMLKERVESLPNFSLKIFPEMVPGFHYLGIRDSSLNEPSLVDMKMTSDYGEINAYIRAYDLIVTGKPFAMYTKSGDFNIEFTCGVPVMETDTIYHDFLQLNYQDSTQSLVGEYFGSYDGLAQAHEDIIKFASYYDFEIIGLSWETYITGYDSELDTNQWQTNIYYPVK